jgi:Cu2+-exporting ATPase
MKNLILAMATTTFFLASCGNGSQSKTTSTEVQNSNEEVLYACPMHPEVTGKKGEKCSKCGMDLTEQKASLTYQCPMKCEGDKVYDKPGQCPKCNMDLKKVEVSHEHDGHSENH